MTEYTANLSLALQPKGLEYVLTSELSARRFMSTLHPGTYTYWHKSACEHIVTVRKG